MEFDVLKKSIAEVLSVDPDEITPESTFEGDLGADSLDLYQILLDVQDQLEIEVDAEEATNVKTVKDALDLIQGTVNG
ncbi:MAG: acyl carrier protein [Lachnospiraceae bacterium]|nr:acyl carrier protein [Lachnospiraceae bacterium]